MKKQIITIGVFATLTMPDIAYCASAVYCMIDTDATELDCPDCTSVIKTISCGSDTYCDCAACVNNGTLTSRTIQTGANQTTTISECPKSLSGGIIFGATCPDACPDSTWTDVSGANYQVRCDGDLLNPQCEYQCGAGFYGTGTSCSQCPEWLAVYTTATKTTLVRGTSDAGATVITACSIPGGTYYDATGTFSLTADCAYSN